jgi:hypothetical protein
MCCGEDVHSSLSFTINTLKHFIYIVNGILAFLFLFLKKDAFAHSFGV